MNKTVPFRAAYNKYEGTENSKVMQMLQLHAYDIPKFNLW